MLHVLLQSGFVLLGLHLGLHCFLGFGVFNGLDDLLLLLLVDEALSHILFNHHFLFEFAFLVILHLLLDTFIISLLQAHHISSALLRLFNLFPGAHLFLFQEGNTIGEHVGILLNAI